MQTFYKLFAGSAKPFPIGHKTFVSWLLVRVVDKRFASSAQTLCKMVRLPFWITTYCIRNLLEKNIVCTFINRSSVAGAVQQTPLSLIKRVILCENAFNILSFPNRQSQGAEMFRDCSPPTTYHMSNVTCHLLLVTCHLSPVMCLISRVTLTIKPSDYYLTILVSLSPS